MYTQEGLQWDRNALQCVRWNTLSAVKDNIERGSRLDPSVGRLTHTQKQRQAPVSNLALRWAFQGKRNCPYSLVPDNSDRLDIPEDSE